MLETNSFEIYHYPTHYERRHRGEPGEPFRESCRNNAGESKL